MKLTEKKIKEIILEELGELLEQEPLVNLAAKEDPAAQEQPEVSPEDEEKEIGVINEC